MIGMGKVKQRIVDDDGALFMGSNKTSRKWVVVHLDHHPFPDPLPELCPGGPELLPIHAQHQGSTFRFPFPYFFCRHVRS